MPDSHRLDELERIVVRITRDLEVVRHELVRLRHEQHLADATATPPDSGAAPAPADRPAAATGDAVRPREFGSAGAEAAAPQSAASSGPRPQASGTPKRTVAGPSMEDVVGRYGALALAVFTILLGAGALVSWAISRGLLTPVVRVALGALLAAALGAGGWHLRRRGQWAFGRVLVALALAVVHVVAWGAGSQLQLIPETAALALADIASLALAALAVHDEDELMLVVGFGGALLAPFVQMSASGNLWPLAAYGVLVSWAALRAIGERRWSRAAGTVVLFTLAYGTVLLGAHTAADWLTRERAPLYAAVLALLCLHHLKGTLRGVSALLITALISWFGAQSWSASAPATATTAEFLAQRADILIAAFGASALALWIALSLADRERTWWAGAALVLPAWNFTLAMFAAIAFVAPAPSMPLRAAIAFAWMVLYGVAWRLESGIRRSALLTAAGLMAMVTVGILLRDQSALMPYAFSAFIVVFVWLSGVERDNAVLLDALMAALVAFAQAANQMSQLPSYGVPFASWATLAFAALTLALAGSAHLIRTRAARDTVAVQPLLPVAWGAAGAVAFIWWTLELNRAFSRDLSTFLLVLYFAASGVLVIWLGRRLRATALRQTGLALSVWAALYAIGEATSVSHIALRVGSYLGVGAFLLGVAWWYRGAARKTDGDASADATTG